jgi:hypothetical protein
MVDVRFLLPRRPRLAIDPEQRYAELVLGQRGVVHEERSGLFPRVLAART